MTLRHEAAKFSPVEMSPSAKIPNNEQEPSKSSYRHFRQAYGTVDKQRAPPQIEPRKKPLAFDKLGPKYLRADLLAPLPTTTQPLLSRDRSAHTTTVVPSKKSSPTLSASPSALTTAAVAAESSGDETILHFSATEQEAALFFRHERALNSLATYVEEPLNRLQLIEDYTDIIDRVIEFCKTRPSRALQERAAYILRLLSSDYSARTFLLEHQILPALKAAIQNGVREVRQHLYMTLEYLVARPLVRLSGVQNEQAEENAPKTAEKEICVARDIIDLGLVPLLLERFKKEKGVTERIMLANVLSSVAVYNPEPLLHEPGKPPTVLNCIDLCMDLLNKFHDLSTDLTTATCRLLQTVCVSQRAKNQAAGRNLVAKLTKIAKEAARHNNFQQLHDDVLQVLGLVTAITVNKHLANTLLETMDVLEAVVATTTPPPSDLRESESPAADEPLSYDEQEELDAANKAEAMRAKMRLHALTVLCNISENPVVRKRLRLLITSRDVWLNIYHDPNELVQRAAARLRRIVMWDP